MHMFSTFVRKSFFYLQNTVSDQIQLFRSLGNPSTVNRSFSDGCTRLDIEWFLGVNASNEEQQATETTSVTFGEKIRHAREARQLSIDDLVGETRINPQHLIDLEEGLTFF